MIKKSKAKKRGVKPGTKRGKYKRIKPMDDFLREVKGWQVIEDEGNLKASYTPSPILTLCGQLEDAILLLENRISNSIAKINSLI